MRTSDNEANGHTGPERSNGSYDFDVAVIGAGPGGNAAALSLRRAGRTVLLLEAEAFPRHHIGESMLPMSNFVFEQLGIRPAVVAAGFQEKWGATFVDAAGEHQTTYDFGELTDLAEVSTYQVLRSELDSLLLDQARAAGATFVQGRATGFASDATGATLEYQTEEGRPGQVRVGAVVDASGRSGFLARRFGVREQDPALQKAAIYGYFRGVPRLEGRRAGDIRVVSVADLAWLWFIPLSDGSMSVGAVFDIDVFKALPEGTPEHKLMAYLETVPAARELVAEAELVSPVRVESGYSYSATAYTGDRWLLVGDAGSFLDPVFSSGVLLALLGGVDAGRAIDAGLRGTALRPGPLRRFERESSRRYRFLRRFILAFYDQGMRDLFFAPRPSFGMLRTIATVLAGGWKPGFVDRRRIGLFYGLAWMQRYLPLVPRLHHRGP